jgi:hypothetical protein
MSVEMTSRMTMTGHSQHLNSSQSLHIDGNRGDSRLAHGAARARPCEEHGSASLRMGRNESDIESGGTGEDSARSEARPSLAEAVSALSGRRAINLTPPVWSPPVSVEVSCTEAVSHIVALLVAAVTLGGEMTFTEVLEVAAVLQGNSVVFMVSVTLSLSR